MKLYSLVFFLLMGFQFALAEDPTIIEKKVIDKTFQVNSNADLSISNKYGNVSMTTWDRNEVSFHIEIQVDGRDSKKVKDRLNSINVQFSHSPNKVSAETIIENMKGNNLKFSIHYFVKLPKNNNIHIKNQYGNISIDNLNGSSYINLKYGNLNAEKLNNPINLHEYQYVTNSTIEYVKSATFNLGYSKLKINQTELANIQANYSDVTIENVNDVVNTLNYGNLNIGNLGSFSGLGNYSNFKVNIVHQSFVLTGNYGAISIKEVKKGFNKVSIGVNYTSLSMGIDADAGYSFEGNFRYGKLQYPSNLILKKLIEKSGFGMYVGKAGNGSGEILLNINYGNAKLTSH